MTKTILRCRAPWAWRKNEADLNRRGQAGWKLEKAGFLRYTFTRTQTPWACAVDYCPRELWPGEWPRRQQAAAEAGWELVSHTLTGWAYFRRPADAAPDGSAPDAASASRPAAGSAGKPADQSTAGEPAPGDAQPFGVPYPRAYTPAQERLLGRMGTLFWIWAVLLAVGAAGAVAAVIRQKAMLVPAVVFLAVALVLYFRSQALAKALKPREAPDWEAARSNTPDTGDTAASGGPSPDDPPAADGQ